MGKKNGDGVLVREKIIKKAWDVVKKRSCFIVGNGRRVLVLEG